MKKLLPYIYDYISILFEENEIKSRINRIILFGSVARGDFGPESDVDIFIETPKKSSDFVEKLVRKAEKRFWSVSENKWRKLGINNPVKSIIGDLDRPEWKELKLEIISYGLVLYGKFESLPENMKHYSLFTYSLSGIQAKEKMKLLRTLFGYTIKKDKKEYRQAGLVEKIGGRKFACNSVLVSTEKSKEVHDIFTGLGVTPEIDEVWMKS